MTDTSPELGKQMDEIIDINDKRIWPVIEAAVSEGVSAETLMACMLEIAATIAFNIYPGTSHEQRRQMLHSGVDFVSRGLELRTPPPMAGADMTNVVVLPQWRDLYTTG